MSDANGYARRYHWLGESVSDFVCEPHNAIDDLSTDSFSRRVHAARPGEQLLLNMVATEADVNRNSSVDLINWNPDKLLFDFEAPAKQPDSSPKSTARQVISETADKEG